MNSDAPLWASALSYRALVALIPLVLLLLGSMSFLLRASHPVTNLIELIRATFPPSQAATLERLIGGYLESGSTQTLAGALVLVLFVLPLFSTLRQIVRKAFGTTSSRLVASFGIDLLMVLEFTLLVVVAVSASLMVRYADGLLAWLFHAAGLDSRWATSGWQVVVRVAGWLVPIAVSFAITYQLLRYMPRPRASHGSALFGAALMALGWEGLNWAFAWYARLFASHWSRLEALVASDLLTGAFALLIGLVAWIYASASLFVLASLAASEYEKKRTQPEG